MSESSANRKSDAQEPSMEDILASIRRILAEDVGAASPDPEYAGAAARTDQPEGFGEEEAETPADRQRAADALFEDVTPRPAPPRVEEDAPPPRAAPVPPPRTREPKPEPEPEAEDEEDVFVLSPEMRALGHKLVSAETAADSTDVLSKLARAILDRRDIAIGTRDLTLEGLVREMLRPLLREWLDRNLPYLIERLVRKEIDLMVNRAERLED